MGPLAAEAPASDVFEDALGDRTGGGATAQPAAGGGGESSQGGPSVSSGFLEGIDVAGNPLLSGLLEILQSVPLPSGSGGGGSTASDGGEPSADSGSSNQETTEQSSGETDETQAASDQSDDGADSATDSSQQSGGSDSGGPSLPESISGLSTSGVAAGFAALALLIVGYVFYTRDDPIGALLSIPGWIASVALAAVVACSQALEQALAALRGVTSIAELPGLVFAVIANALRSVRARVGAAGSSVSATLFGGAEDRTDGDAAAEEHVPARERIRRAFETVIDASPMYRHRAATATPADVARSATDAGAPDDPVETITESFRDVEYGDRDPEPYLERTTTARDRLRDVRGEDAEGEPEQPRTEPDTEEGADE
jgi:hypothetical protein